MGINACIWPSKFNMLKSYILFQLCHQLYEMKLKKNIQELYFVESMQSCNIYVFYAFSLQDGGENMGKKNLKSITLGQSMMKLANRWQTTPWHLCAWKIHNTFNNMKETGKNDIHERLWMSNHKCLFILLP